MDAATIVKRIRALGGITRKELAELADLAPSTVGRIERSEMDPTWGTLSRILSSVGYQISGDAIVSAGDASAVAAARPLLSATLATAARNSGKLDWPGLWESVMDDLSVSSDLRQGVANEWWDRWQRAGWLNDGADADDLVTLAVSAGNAAKISRRGGVQRAVEAPDGWQSLARIFGEVGVDYAVSGLVATREDRSSAESNLPVFYVEYPVDLASRFSLSPAPPGQGVLLIEASNGELDEIEVDDGIRFVPRSQAILDALAGSGREPDKAENELRKLLSAA